ncbi:MAG: HIRAN domain-containing protein [Actinobacteria bacterium]|nr:HIRAN domain-containing protein [Actinomycetota bacterium]
MNKDVTKLDPKMLEILRALQNGKSLPKPFCSDTLVLKTYIAGTQYSSAKKIAGSIKEGNYLIFQREAKNPNDNMAIKIMDLDKNKLGYVPRAKNEVISNLMDAGKTIFGIIDKKDWSEDYLRLDISIYLREL